LAKDKVREPAKLAAAVAALKHAKVGGVIVLTDPMFIGQRRAIADLALSNRLPAIYYLRQFVEVGGLMSYGAEYAEIFEQSAMLVAKILRGTKPADLPVEQPWRYTMAINLKTAKAFGLTTPPGWRAGSGSCRSGRRAGSSAAAGAACAPSRRRCAS
jgi:putative ABC transport system substrate-binding protein